MTTCYNIPQMPHYKLLCLIIASKDDQYPQFEQQWRKYIDKIGANLSVKFFFIYCTDQMTIDPETHTITLKDNESLIPGIFNKTIHAMTETIQIDYDYLLRTNLSSFFDFRKLLAYLDMVSPKNYTGTFLEISNEQIEMTVKGGLSIKIPTIFLNGAAFLMSKDVVFNTVSKYSQMTPDELSYIITLPDDVAITLLVAGFYNFQFMKILPRFAPLSKITLYDIPRDIFHVRLKTPHMFGGSRHLDIENMKQLVEQMIMSI